MDAKLHAELIQLHAEICSALADCTRIQLLYVLAESPRTVNELSDALALPQPNVSRHLKVLKERGLVCSNRDGQAQTYFLPDLRVIQALDILRSVLINRLQDQSSMATQFKEALS